MTETISTKYPNIIQSFGIVGIILLGYVVFIPIYFLDNLIGKESTSFIYYILVIGIPFLIVHLIRKKNTGISEYNFRLSSPKIIVLVSITIIAIQIGISLPIIIHIPMPDFMVKMFNESYKVGIFSFITIVLAAPILEELIFRGIILDGLLQRYSPVKSLIISSLLFGIVHLNPWQFVSAIILGSFSGWVYYKTKKLILSILIHLVNNLFFYIQSCLQDVESTMDKSSIELYGGVIYFILITVGSILTAIICIYILRREFNKIKTKSSLPIPPPISFSSNPMMK